MSARKRAASIAATTMLVFGAGVAGAVTSPAPPGGIRERPEAATIFELLEVPEPGPTTTPEPPDEGGTDEGGTEDPPEEDGPGTDSSSHGKLVSDAAHDDSYQGCEKGMHVSEVASSKSQGKGHANRPDPCSRGARDHGADDEGGSNTSGGGSGGGSGPPPHAGPPPGVGGPPPGAGPPGGGGPPPGAGPGGP